MQSSEDMPSLDQLCTDLFAEVQKHLDSPMPAIGLYIAGVSSFFVLAMFGDTFYGFISKRIWIPCKLFPLNGLSLTLLTVAMKLPVDLTSNDLSLVDQKSRVTSLVFMCICLNQFMISLGSLDNRELLLNIISLATLVFTVTLNVCVHMFQMNHILPMAYYMFPLQSASLVCMLQLLAFYCSLSLMIPSARRYTELKFGEMHRLVSSRQSPDEVEWFVRRCWVMVETGDLQFLLARCSISLTATLLSFVASLITLDVMAVGLKTEFVVDNYCPAKTSSYGRSTSIILVFQIMVVGLGGAVQMIRWFVFWRIKATEMEQASFRNVLKVHSYWTSMLVELRDAPLPFRVQNASIVRISSNFDIIDVFLLVCWNCIVD